MQMRLHLAIAVIVALMALAFFFEWRSERRNRAHLQSVVIEAERSLKNATANQQQRDKQLTDTVSKLEALKTTVRTQHQILTRLPDVLPLPKPIQLADIGELRTHFSRSQAPTTNGSSSNHSKAFRHPPSRRPQAAL